MKKFLITGAAGFIGARLVEEVLKENHKVVGIDNLNNYYNVQLKKERLKKINDIKNKNWDFYYGDIKDLEILNSIFKNHEPDIVINLAAQAGVRYSLENPLAYIDSNLVGFGNILEMCRKFCVKHLVYASSSSVYGANRSLPYSEEQPVNHPVSLYAATKKSNELMAHSYSHLYSLKATGLRFFTVYGPWGRPDMAPMIFAKSILKDRPINIYNNGDMKRDFTYIDDIVKAVYKCSLKSPEKDEKFDLLNPNPATSFAPHKIFNIGNSSPVNLLNFVDLMEKKLGKKAIKIFKPLQPGDVLETSADTNKLEKWINYKPQTEIDFGIEKFAKWFLKEGNNF